MSYFFRRKDLYKIQKKILKNILKIKNLLSVSVDTKKDFSILKKFLIKNQSYEINKKKLYNYLRKKKNSKMKLKQFLSRLKTLIFVIASMILVKKVV